MHYQPFLNMAIIENWLSSKCCKFAKIHFFSTILLHTHLQYVWNMSAKYQKRILKAVGGVDFTKYALLALWQTFHVRGMAEKFVDTSAIRKSNALLKKRFA